VIENGSNLLDEQAGQSGEPVRHFTVCNFTVRVSFDQLRSDFPEPEKTNGSNQALADGVRVLQYQTMETGDIPDIDDFKSKPS
jgi:hypothetical protein